MNGKDVITMFLCGDVMLGRGVDQILHYPSDPALHEDYIKDAKDYVKLAEAKSGPIPRKVNASYVWGQALYLMNRPEIQARIINLETSITNSSDWMNKGINYRMSPKNIDTLLAAKVDVCTLANNHTLDWGEQGLVETMDILKKQDIQFAGAGHSLEEAAQPATVELSGGGRILVFSCAMPSSGVPLSWAAGTKKLGLNVIKDYSQESIDFLARRINLYKRDNDIAVISIHWEGNWGYEIPKEQTEFARALIDEGADIIHGHSSHHFKGIEVYREKLIIYGCGDFINDYEGIKGFEKYHGELSLMFFPAVELSTGKLRSLVLIPMRLSGLHLVRAIKKEVQWVQKILNREGLSRQTHFILAPDDSIEAVW